MSDEIREQLSALKDGELPRDQVRFLLRRIDGDARLARSWTNYHLAGDALRQRTVALPLREDFADALMQRIDHGTSGVGKHLLRWVGGGAIAAAVAVFALVSTRPAAGPEPAAMLAAAPVAAHVDAPAPRAVTLPPQPAFDFAQPASFDRDNGVIALPSYRREQPATLGPYVLLTTPPTQTTADASQR
jgi:sigma-E factor negative regulatory protein RseA